MSSAFLSALANDLDVFFADFGQDAVYSGDGKTVQVIFDRSYMQLTPQGIAVESTDPMALVKTADVPGIDHTKTLTIDGTVWKVREVKPDGTGITTVMLKA